MSPRAWQERIEDILQAIAEIQDFTRGQSFEDFCADPKTIRAVELNFIVVGEAAGQVPDEIVSAHSEIPWDVMRAMRNQLVHRYFAVAHEILWDTIHNDLPPLVDPLRKLLESNSSSN